MLPPLSFLSTALQHLLAGYSVAVFLLPLLCTVQPIAAQSSSTQHWLSNELLGRTLFASISLVFLGPLPNKILPEGYNEPPRTPAIAAAYQFRMNASNSSIQV